MAAFAMSHLNDSEPDILGDKCLAPSKINTKAFQIVCPESSVEAEPSPDGFPKQSSVMGSSCLLPERSARKPRGAACENLSRGAINSSTFSLRGKD